MSSSSFIGSLPSLSKQSTIFWSTSLSILVAYLLFAKSRVYDVRPNARVPAHSESLVRSIRSIVTLLLAIHSVILARRILNPPINIFTYFDLPLSAPTPLIRTSLKNHLSHHSLALPALETLLTRLTSLEGRLTYLKYGPTPLTTCPIPLCTTQTDFALFAFPSTALAYLATLILCSLLTVQSTFARQDWRRPAMLVLACCAGSEWWWSFITTTISVAGEESGRRITGLTYTHIYLIRNTILFLLPLLLHHLPPGSTLSTLPPFIVVNPSNTNTNAGANPNPITTLKTLISDTSSTLTALHALKLFREAGSRNTKIRERIADYYTTIERNAALVRDDLSLREFARLEGFGYSYKDEDESKVPPTPPSGDDYGGIENGASSTHNTTGSHLDLKLRNRAREIAQGIVKTYLFNPPQNGNQ